MEVLNKYYNTTLARVDMHPNKKNVMAKMLGFPLSSVKMTPIQFLGCAVMQLQK